MRRAPIVLAATVAGFAGVLSFHTSGTTINLSGSAGGASASSGSTAATGRASSSGSSAAKSSSSSSSSSSSGPSSSSGATSGSGSTGPAASGGSGGAKASSGGGSAPSAAASTGGASGGVRSATGRAENFGYGIMSVKVTVHGSRISAVAVASLQVAEPTSQYICEQAVPMLRSEVLSAQSARINAISGATYTSEAYAYSLQSALDKLHVK